MLYQVFGYKGKSLADSETKDTPIVLFQEPLAQDRHAPGSSALATLPLLAVLRMPVARTCHVFTFRHCFLLNLYQ